MSVFMTGATGFLGRYLLRGLLDADQEVVLLVRGRDQRDAWDKVRKALASLGPVDAEALGSQLQICLGSLEQPGLGLAPEDRARVLERCDSFLHCGASVRFDLPLQEARATNVGGTLSMLELARERHKKGGTSRFDYVGTAYVAGNRTDLVLETELDGKLGHKNTYEQSKFEAEGHVRQAMADLPVTVYRPSIVVGESEQGRTSSFKMIYWPAKIYATGLWRTCPGNPEAPIDLVPVNFVRDAILEIRRKPESLGRCFHLAAGPQGALTLGQTADLVREIFPGRKPVRFVDPGWWMRFVHPVLKYCSFGAPRRIVRTGEFYVPYFTHNPRFDITGTAEMLGSSKVVLPRVGDYIHQLFRYCVETDWGKKPAA